MIDIDNRVVQMVFENAGFIASVGKTLISLTKLDDGLDELDNHNFDNLRTSIYGLQDAMVPMSGIADTIMDRFSVLEQFITGGIRRMGEKFVDFSMTMVKSLSTDQISEGWTKYEKKTEAIQTMMSAMPDKTIEEISGYVENLAWFSDETSYSFTDMTDALSKFVSAGMDLDESTIAIQGLAAAAASAGVSTQKAGSAFYNFSQAMGTGAMKLQDWKSIENLNMASKELKQQFIEAGVALGKLKKVGKNTYGIVGKLSDTFNSESFSSLLSKGWLDKDTMMYALKNYGSFAEQVRVYSDENDMTASEAIKKLDELGEAVGGVGEKGFKAAQEAKTFNDAIDATKDAVSSGWMATFEEIFGNYEEAKVLWTDLANGLYDVFAEGGNQRNELLKKWSDEYYDTMTGTMKDTASFLNNFRRNSFFDLYDEKRYKTGRDMLIESFYNLGNFLVSIINTVKDAFSEVFPMPTVKQLMIITEKFKELTERIQLSDEQLEKISETAHGIFATLKGIIKFLGSLGKIIWYLLDALSPLLGLFDGFDTGMVKMGDSIDEAADKFSNFVSTNEKFLGVFKMIKDAMTETTKSIKDAITQLQNYFKTNGFNFNSIMNLLRKASLSIVDSITNILETITGKDLSSARNKIKGNIESIFEAIDKVSKKLVTAGKNISDFVKKAVNKFNIIRTGILDKINANNPEEAMARFTGVFAFFSNLISGLQDSMMVLLETVDRVFSSISDDIKRYLGLDESASSLETIEAILANIGKWCQSILKLFGDILGFTFGSLIDERGFLDLEKILKLITGGALAGLALKLKSIVDDIGDTSEMIPKILESLFKPFLEAQEAEEKENASEWMRNMAVSLAILAGSLLVLSMIPADKLNNAVTVISGLLTELVTILFILGKGFKVIGSVKLDAITSAMLIIASSVIILSVALAIISSVDPNNLLASVFAIILLIGSMTASLIVMSKYSGAAMIAVETIITMSYAVLVMAAAVALLSLINWKAALIGTGVVSALMWEMVAVTLVLTKNMGAMNTGAATILALATSLIIISAAAFILGKMKPETLIQGGTAVVSFIAIMSLAMYALSKGDAGNMIAGAYAILLISASMAILASAVTLMSTMDWKGMGIGLISFTAMLGVIVGALAIMSRFDTEGMITSAVTLVICAAAMNIFASAILSLSTMSWEQMGVSLISFVVILGAVLAMTWLFSKMDNGIENILMFSMAMVIMAAGISVFAIAMKKLQDVDLKTAAIGLGIILGFVVILALVGSALSEVGPILLAMGVIMMGLGIIVAGFGAGILLAAMAFDVFLGAAIKLTDYLDTNLKRLLKNISESAPEMAEAVVSLIKTIRDSLVEASPMVKEIFEMILDVIIEVLTRYVDRFVMFTKFAIDTLSKMIIQYTPKVLSTLSLLISNITGFLIRTAPQLFAVANVYIMGFIAMLRLHTPALFAWLRESLHQLNKLILDAVPDFIVTAVDSLLNLLKALEEKIPEIIVTGCNIIIAFMQGLNSKMPEIALTATNLVTAFLKGIEDNLPTITDEAVKLLIAFLDSISQAIDNNASELIDSIYNLIEKILKLIGLALEKKQEFMKKIAKKAWNSGFVQGIKDDIKNAIKAVELCLSKMKDAILNKVKDFKDAGINLVKGLTEGFEDPEGLGKYNPITQMKKLCNKITGAAEEEFDINSPSKVFTSIARYCVAGLTKGFKDYGSQTVGEVENYAGNITDTMAKSLSGIETMDSSMVPKIKPVVDLSNITAANGTLNTTFSEQNLGAIAAGINNNVTFGESLDRLNAAFQNYTVNSDKKMDELIDAVNKEQPVNVDVSLNGDANKLFRMVQNESSMYRKATGKSAFA